VRIRIYLRSETVSHLSCCNLGESLTGRTATNFKLETDWVFLAEHSRFNTVFWPKLLNRFWPLQVAISANGISVAMTETPKFFFADDEECWLSTITGEAMDHR